MPAIECLEQGIVYRNPLPHVRSIHTYFPSVVAMDNGQLLATLVLGEAFEAVNLHTWLARSMDGGRTWDLEGEIYPGTADRLTSDACRITALPGGEIVAFMVRHDRSEHPNEGLTSHDTLGFVPTELLLLRSQDYGRTWGEPQALTPPLEGPSFELCAPITPLRNGVWLLPTSTWRGWDGDCPDGMKMIAFVSTDGGESWPQYVDVMADPEGKVIFWESKVVELADGRLLATAWGFDEAEGADLPNQFVLSEDGGRTWTHPRSTGLQGQTLTPLALPDGRILSVYRRVDEPGLWANLSHIEGEQWINDDCGPLWGAREAGLTRHSDNMAQNFNVLRFGAPCLVGLGEGEILGAFWCYEDCVSNVRWFRLRVE